MKRFQQLLKEALKTAYEWNWYSKSSTLWEGDFQTEDTNIRIKLQKVAKNWKLILLNANTFYDKRFDATDHTSPKRVLLTVSDMVKDFLKNQKPDIVYLNRDNNKLYDTILQKFGNEFKQLDYKIDTELFVIQKLSLYDKVKKFVTRKN